MVGNFATISETINKWGAALAFVGLLVGAMVYLYSTAKRGRQDVIRQDNIDLRASNQEMRTEKIQMETTIKEARDTIVNLRDIATQTPAVTKLIEINNKQQEQAAKQHTEVIQGLSKLTGEISKLAKAINDDRKGQRNGR